MFLSKISSIFFNSTTLSRLTHNLSLILFIFLLGFFLDETISTNIFKFLAVIKIGSSLLSFGFGTSILKPLNAIKKKEKNTLLLHVVYAKLFLVFLLSLYVNQFYPIDEVSFGAFFLVFLGSVWGFVDLYVEILPKKAYKNYFFFKAILSVIALLFKLCLLYDSSHLLYYFLTIEGLFPLVFLVYTILNKWEINLGLQYRSFVKVYELVVYTTSIWISSFIQIGGSRLVFLVIESVVSSRLSTIYYLVLRSTEGLLFIPNNICASLFNKTIKLVHNSEKQLNFRKKTLKTCIFASLVIAPVFFATILVFANQKKLTIIDQSFIFVLSVGVVFLSFFRVWLSREIVINNNLKSSPISYLTSFFCTIPFIYILSNYGIAVLFSLLIYYIVASTTPLMVSPNKMKITRKLIKNTLCLKR